MIGDRAGPTDAAGGLSVSTPTRLAPLDPEAAQAAGALARSVLDAVGGVVLGQEAVLEQMLVTLLAGGHALLEGVPGTAKTLAISALSRSLDTHFGRIQFTPDLMPTDVTGVNVLDELSRRFEFRRGPLFAELLLADEINRAPAKTQAALLEAMQERQVTVDGASHALPALFTVFASQNPVEYEGTYPLPEAQLDRFLLKIRVDYPAQAAELAMLDRYAGGFDASVPATFGLQPLLARERLLELRALVTRVRVEPEVRAYVVALVRETRARPALSLGASPRATVAVFRAAQACALLEGRDFVIPEDVKRMAVPALRHRVLLTAEAEVEGGSADAEIAGVVAAVPAPR